MTKRRRRSDASAPPDSRARRRISLPLALAGGGLALVLVLALGLSGGRRPAPQGGPAELAQEFARSGDYRRAAQTLEAALGARPTPALRLETARAFLLAGDHAEALDLLAPPAEDPRYEHSRRHLLAEALLRSGRFEEAGSQAASLIATAPGDGRARLLKARVALGAGDIEEARRALGEAIRIGGEALSEAWLFRARLALSDNDFEAARSAAARAAGAGAAAAFVAAVDIEALARAGRFVEARAALARLVAAKDPSAGVAVEQLAIFIDAAAGRYEDAARRLRDIAPLIEAEPFGGVYAARIARFSGDVAQGEAGLVRALDSAPDNAILLAARVEDLIGAGRFDDADEAAARLARVDPRRGATAALVLARARNDFDLLARLAATQALQGDRPPPFDALLFGARSDAALKSARRLEADMRLVDAVAAARKGEVAAAAARLSSAGGDPAALILAGELFLAAAADERAAAVFQRALALAPRSQAALIGLARIDVRGGGLAAAEQRLAAAKGPIATLARARAAARQGRIAHARNILAPVIDAASDRPHDAAFAAAVFAARGDRAALTALTEGARRKRPDAPETVDLLFGAGRIDAAVGAARAALVAAPHDAGRASAYASLMIRAGRRTDGAALLAELIRRSGESESLAAAVRMLDGAAIADPSPPSQDPAPESPGSIREAQMAYIATAGDPGAAAFLARSFADAGEPEAAIRLRREACFFADGLECS